VIICQRVITSNSISVLNSQYLHVTKTTIKQYFFKSGVFLGNIVGICIDDRYNILN